MVCWQVVCWWALVPWVGWQPAKRRLRRLQPSADPLPQRVLGRTGVSVTALTLGTAPCGLCPKIPTTEIAKIVNLAIDLGITSIDTAPAYTKSEESVGMALGARRKDIFLATKVLADTVEDAQTSLDKSFRLLKTDWIDLVYYHSAGDHDVEKAMQPGGVFDWLLQQKKAGQVPFSGHLRTQSSEEIRAVVGNGRSGCVADDREFRGSPHVRLRGQGAAGGSQAQRRALWR